MAKLIPDTILDLQLDQIEGTTIHVCHDPAPTTYGEIAAVDMASQPIAGSYTKAPGDTSGRKTTCPIQTGVNITKTDTATHVAISDGAGILYCVTTVTSQPLTSGGTVDIPAWDAEIGDPT